MAADRPRRTTRTINVESPVNVRLQVNSSTGGTSVASSTQDAPIVQTTRRSRRTPTDVAPRPQARPDESAP